MPELRGVAMANGCDTTDHNLTGAELAAANMAFVCRYFSDHVNQDWKDIHAAEVADKTAHHVRIVSNWELMANPVNDRATGRAVAREFLAEQDALPGHVDWNPCYYSLDTRSSTAGAWDEYAKGWADILTPERCGAYAEGLVLKHLLALGVIKWTWLSMSTSFPGATGYTLNLRQTGSGHIAGSSVDFDTALTPLYGGWYANEPDPTGGDMALTPADAAVVVAALKADPSYMDIAWRVEAMAAGRDTYLGGSVNVKGKPVGLTALIKKIPTTAPATPAELAAAIVTALGPDATITPAELETALLAVFGELGQQAAADHAAAIAHTPDALPPAPEDEQ